MRILPALDIVLVIAIARMACSTTRRTGILPVVIINILVDYLISAQWSQSEEVTWFVNPAAWPVNLCPEINAAISTEMITGSHTLP